MAKKKASKKTVGARAAKPKLKKKSRRRQAELTAALVAEAIDENRNKLPKQTSEFADALAGNNRRTVEKMLADGMKVDAKVVKNYTPIMIAAACGNHAILKLLLGKGADPNSCPVLLLCYDEPSKVKELLKAGADPNASDSVSTPLARAIESTERGAVDLLIKAGATIGKQELAVAKRVNDPKINKLLGIAAPPPQKLFVPPLLSKPLKAGFTRIYEVTGWPPLGLGDHGMKVFACQIDPDRFLSAAESIRYNAQERAAESVAQQLFGSVDGCEFARSNASGETVLLLDSKNKFYFLKNPSKLLKWLQAFDAAHPVALFSMYDGRSVYRLKKKLTPAQIKKSMRSWHDVEMDAVEIKLTATELVVDYDS